MDPAAVWLLVGLVAVAGLLAAEARDSRQGIWIAKPLASTAFLGFALERGALASSYGRIILLALILSWAGDVLLIPKGARRAFAAGLASFLVGHLAYAAAFVLRGIEPLFAAAAAVVCGLLAAAVLRWLLAHVPPPLKIAVVAYTVVISVMVVFAVGTAGRPVTGAVAPAGGALLLGALAFYASDLAVARQRFVVATITNKLWGLPLYYGGQFLLASTVGTGG